MPNLTSRKEIKLKVQEGKKKERLDIYLVSVLEHATRNRVQKLIKEGLVLVNGKVQKANYQINPGDEIHVSIPVTPHPSENLPEDIPLDIVYEDEFLLVVNKPAGMVVHPAFGNYTGTLVNALLHHTKNLSGINTPERPGIVHRLDKDTSGLILIAKNDWTHSQLAKQFSEHSIEREYWAICWGKFKNKKGEIIKNIARSKSDRKKFTVSDSEGKHAHTIYEVLEEFEFTSLVKLNLKTGRTHQIRVHLESFNHPVFGDPTYGGRKIVYGLDLPKIKARVNNLLEIMPRQALHAKTLGFFHPDKKEFFLFDSPLPSDFQTLLEKLSSNS